MPQVNAAPHAGQMFVADIAFPCCSICLSPVFEPECITAMQTPGNVFVLFVCRHGHYNRAYTLNPSSTTADHD